MFRSLQEDVIIIASRFYKYTLSRLVARKEHYKTTQVLHLCWYRLLLLLCDLKPTWHELELTNAVEPSAHFTAGPMAEERSRSRSRRRRLDERGISSADARTALLRLADRLAADPTDYGPPMPRVRWDSDGFPVCIWEPSGNQFYVSSLQAFA